MIKINEKYLVKILDEDYFGNGITRIDNFVIVVPHSFKDEDMLIKINKINKRFATSNIVEIKSKSPKRINSLCPVYDLCGGCDYLHLNSIDEKNHKTSYISDLFKIKIDNYYNVDSFRNKVIFHVQNNKIGFYEKESNKLVELNKCLLLNKRTLKIYTYLKNINLSKIKEVLVRETHYTDEVLININGELDNIDSFIKDINPTSLYLNNKLIYGKEYIIEDINGFKFIITPNSFFQINSANMVNLYNTVKDYAGTGNNLLDLYCGSGTIGIYLKDNFKNVLGIDNVLENINNANKNKELNNSSNINFKYGDAALPIANNYDAIIVDPPRSGLSNNVIKNLIKAKAKKIIYVSCNPKTLKRDLDLLEIYKLDRLTVVNMFPRTKHIECVVLLQLNH